MPKNTIIIIIIAALLLVLVLAVFIVAKNSGEDLYKPTIVEISEPTEEDLKLIEEYKLDLLRKERLEMRSEL